MNKKKIILGAVTALAALGFQSSASACTGFIIGKDLTKDGSTLYGRTEDLEPNHNKNFLVRKAKDNKSGEKWKDQANGFEYPLPKHSFKYTAVPDVTPEEGVYDEAGSNEYGVSMSATVSASANKKILKVDPYVKDGLAESSMASVILPSVKTAKEGIQLIAKIVDEKGSAEGNIVTIADKEGIWYMEILSGHQYVAIKFPNDKFAVFPNTFYLGQVNFDDKENTIASADVQKVAQKAKSFKKVDGKFHVSRSYNPPMNDANRSRAFSGIKSLDPDSKVTYKDDNYELLQSTNKKFTLEDAQKLQRNRFEGLDLKPLDQMELDGKGKPKSKEAIKGYAYPISNPNVMEAHIFQLKDDVPAELGGGVMWLSIGSPRNAPYLPYLGNISKTYKAYQEKSTKYNGDSWYWTISHINDMVAANPKKFGTEVIDEMKKLEKTWMTEQETTTKEVSDLVSKDPAAAEEKANKVSMDRAEKTFKRLKEIEKKLVKESKKVKKAKSKN
ncbi:C69 family dipeptidase [Streptococcus catagoni]|uniref:C69 family dipeptidase n=1 Tax=Streptococcus catagoni TaxID=2654874 RepID=UPI001407BA6E|nr:C69 family dipeptidase [Streptococcus catagoni]